MIVASIDIGTNTVLLLIAKVEPELNLEVLVNEYRIPRMGKGLVLGGNFLQGKIDDLFAILDDYSVIIERHKCNRVLVTATNAFRIAGNGEETAQKIREKYGWDVKIVTGFEEARLSYMGAISGIKTDSEMLVIDIGGGSTELTFGTSTEMKFRESFSTGVVSATESFFKNDPPLKSEIKNFRDHLTKLFEKLTNLNYASDLAIALAGTPTTLACMKMNMGQYDEDKVEGSILKFPDIEGLISRLSNLSSNDILKEYKTVVKGREDLILSGAIILLFIMELLDINKVIVSTKGIRYGAILAEQIGK